MANTKKTSSAKKTSCTGGKKSNGTQTCGSANKTASKTTRTQSKKTVNVK